MNKHKNKLEQLKQIENQKQSQKGISGIINYIKSNSSSYPDNVRSFNNNYINDITNEYFPEKEYKWA